MGYLEDTKDKGVPETESENIVKNPGNNEKAGDKGQKDGLMDGILGRILLVGGKKGQSRDGIDP